MSAAHDPQSLILDPQQRLAIERCCNRISRLVAVTGGAGTGKTTIIQQVHNELTSRGLAVACGAPTGKAAKRIHEATGIPAQTFHRMLGYGQPLELEVEDEETKKEIIEREAALKDGKTLPPKTKVVRVSTGPGYSRQRSLPYDVILGDEYMMVNTEIHRNLIDALAPGALIRCFGDANQLRPIETDRVQQTKPAPFQDVLARFAGVTLETIHRQSEGSGIIENANRILKGFAPIKRPDFDIRMTDEKHTPITMLADFVKSQREQGIDFTTTDAQVITCMNKSWIGTKKLNIVMQSWFWDRELEPMSLPRGKWDASPELRVQVGSKVVYTNNVYDLGDGQSIFNGEVGIVVALDHDDGSVDIDVGDRIVTIPPYLVTIRGDGSVVESDPRTGIELAYVLTTHKMQGSECKHSCIMLDGATIYAQSRRNFYTAATRARQRCTVITDYKSLVKSVKFPG